MPELPEVTTITKQLKKEIVGRKIAEIAINSSYKTYPSNEDLIKSTKQAAVTDVFRVAKVIVIELYKEKIRSYLTIHLAMTGRIKFHNEKDISSKLDLVVFELDNASKIVFTDQRRFGYVKIFDEKEFQEFRQKYGPDPLKMDLSEFEKQVKSKKTNIKNALLDQRLIAGIGNIYANDALFLAKIHPKTKTLDITREQLSILLKHIQNILNEAIEHRGSTLEDLMYTDIYGNYGEHQKYFRIYGRNRKLCTICRSEIEFMTLNGRGTYFCPNCQVLHL